MFFVDICPVCFFCSCSARSPFDSTLLSCRLFSGMNPFVVTICCSVIVGLHKLLLFGLLELFLDDTVVHSFVMVLSSHMLSMVVVVGASLYKISMIAPADSNSSNTFLS